QRLIDRAVVTATDAQGVQKGNPGAKRPPQNRTTLCGVDKLRTAFAHATWIVDCVFPLTREVATFHRNPNVAIEVARDAHGCIGIGYVKVLFEPDAAVYGVEVAVSAVYIDSRVRIFRRTLAGLRVHVRARAEKTGGDCK